jgi:hypothetical protein
VTDRGPIVYLSGYCNGELPPTPAPVGGPVPDRTKWSGHINLQVVRRHRGRPRIDELPEPEST